MPRPRRETTCLDRAYRLLARRQHSVFELREKLRAKGHDEGEVEDVVEKLSGLGYLDDESYCRRWAAARVEKARLGPMRLRMDLVRKGFEEDLIDDTVEGIFSADEKELEVAFEAAVKKARSFKPGTDIGEMRRRLFEALARRGFSADIARRMALDELEKIMEKKERK